MGGPAAAHQEVVVTTSRTPWGTWSASSLPCFHPARSLPWQGRRALAKYGTIRGRKNLPSFAGDEWRGREMAGRVVAGDAALREHLMLRCMVGLVLQHCQHGSRRVYNAVTSELCTYPQEPDPSALSRSWPDPPTSSLLPGPERGPHRRRRISARAKGGWAGGGGGGGGQEKRRRRGVTDARVCPGVRPRLPPLRHR